MQRSRGFTLIEVLVVMLIVGVLATGVTLSLAPDTHRVMGDEAVRFARLLEQATDSAELGAPLALVWRADGYGFRRLSDDGRWLEAGDEFFADRHWPDGVKGAPAQVAGRAQADGEPIPLWQDGQAPTLLLPLRLDGQTLDIMLSPLGFARVDELSEDAP